MIEDKYPIEASLDLKTFEFLSIGPKGAVTKVVKFTGINIKGFYNLGFGDKDPLSGYINDLSITNNFDSRKVLATVAATLYVFTNYYYDASIIATGSTKARTRLYQMGISNNLVNIEKDFFVFGLIKNLWEPFKKNVNYDAFFVKRKSVNL